MSPHDLFAKLAGLPWRFKILALAVVVVLAELLLRRYAPKSRVYRGWTATFEAIGAAWTAVLLALVYALSVGPVGLVQRLFGKDPLDRRLLPEPSFWRAHQANPLGPEQAARHQF
ncbi:MAG TPA: hypothetical protein VEQ10_18755 [Vicinamibacteria bacterium]|nr:hypothetical protein [Vicinamibacteria bacterium]